MEPLGSMAPTLLPSSPADLAYLAVL